MIQVQSHEIFERDGNNLKVTIPVAVVSAVLGGKVNVPTLTGSVKLTIPAGTQGGRTFRLKGKGMPDLRKRDVFGDLLATVRIIVPEELNVEERSLYTKLAEISEKTSS